MKKDLYGKIGYIENNPSTVPVNQANTCEENRITFVTELAAVSRGADASKNPPRRYKRLLEEAAPDRAENYKKAPSRPMEFLPVVYGYKLMTTCGEDEESGELRKSLVVALTDLNQLNDDDEPIIVKIFTFVDFSNGIGRHSFIDNGRLYTNMRASINAGIDYGLVPYNTEEQLSLFRAFRVYIPMFVWAQTPNTHTQISKEAQSDRFDNEPDYWLPEDFRQKVYEYSLKHDYQYKSFEEQEVLDTDDTGMGKLNGSYPDKTQRQLTDVLLSLQDFTKAPYVLIGGDSGIDLRPTQHDIETYFKNLGYNAEIYQRAMYYFKYKLCVMTGWSNDPKVWNHFLLEREAYPEIHSSWVQPETKTFALAIKELLESDVS